MNEILTLAVVDAEHPWPGLMPFTEDASAWFHGRDREATELLRLIKREPLTVLFGQSGLGKSSLINAGLFPKLRVEDFFPVYIRLDVSATAPAFSEQVKSGLVANCTEHAIDAPAPLAADALWTYFHRRDTDFWSSRNKLLTPVIVFDQFEEIFTLGRHAEALEKRCRDFVTELADLIEDRMPLDLATVLEANPTLGEEIDFAKQRCKIVFSFREDYLPEFEGLRSQIRSIMQNRMRLTRMSGTAACGAIQQAGGKLVSASVAEQIVLFVAAQRAGRNSIEMDRQEVEPALLSVVCRELNNQRIREQRPQITADLLQDGAQQRIIQDFYEASLDDLDSRVRNFVEDQLLTDAGYRDSAALDDALRMPGVTRERIDTLISRRLLRLEERSGVLRVELTHDVLTQVARDSRDLRKAEEEAARQREIETARRRRIRRLAALGVVTVACLLGIAVVFAVLLNRANEERRHLIQTQSLMLLSRANTGLDQGIPAEPYAVLAQAIRLNPDNRAAVARAVSLLEQRRHAVQISSIKLTAQTNLAWYDNDHFLLGSTATQLWSNLNQPDKGQVIGILSAKGDHEDFGLISPVLGEPRLLSAGMQETSAQSKTTDASAPYAYHAESRLLSFISSQMVLHLFDPASRQRLGRSVQLSGIPHALQISPNRKWVAALDGKGNLLLANLEAKQHVTLPAGQEKLSEDNALPFVTDQGTALICFEQGCSLFRPDNHPQKRISTKNSSYAKASPDGRWAAIASGSEIRLYDLTTVSPEGSSPLPHQAAVRNLAFSPDSRYLASASLDKHARVWEISNQRMVGDMKHDGAVLSVHFAGSAEKLVTGSADGAARVWQPFLGKLLVEPMVHPDAVLDALPQPDGQHLLTITYAHELFIWKWKDASQPEEQKIGQASGADLAVSSHNQKRFALSDATGGLSLYESDVTGKIHTLWQQPGGGKPLTNILFSPDDQLVVTSDNTGFITFRKTDSGAQHGVKLRHGQGTNQLLFSHDGTQIASTGSDRQTRFAEVSKTSWTGSRFSHQSEPGSMAFSRDDKVLLTGDKGKLQLWDVTSGERLDETVLLDQSAIERGERILWAHMSADQPAFALAVAGNHLFSIRLKKASAKRLVFDKNVEKNRQITLGDFKLWTTAYSPKENLLAVGALDGRIRIVDLSTLSIIGETMKHDDSVIGLVFSKNGERLLSWSEDRSVRLWDSRTGYPTADPITPDADGSNQTIQVSRAVFVERGRSVAISCSGMATSIERIGAIPDNKTPEWLPQFVELAGGGKLDAQGASVRVQNRQNELNRLESLESARQDAWQKWRQDMRTKLTKPASGQVSQDQQK